MKKLITMLTFATIATGVFAQGQVFFENFTGNISTNSVASPFAPGSFAIPGGSGPISGPNGYYFTLLFDTAGTPANNNPLTLGWTQATTGGVPIIGTNYPTIAGDMWGPKGIQTMLVDNWAAGTAGSFIIVGWSASLGTWAQVASDLATDWDNAPGNGYYGWFGVSSIGTGTPTAIPAAPYGLFGGSGAPGNTFVLEEVPTPEPATMTLAALGGASLLLFRRKK
jgi:hypothetical protein